MKPAPFRYERPLNIEQAAGLLGEHGPDARVLAGGQSLMPLMNMRLARPAVLVDINRIDSLRGTQTVDGHLSVGAAVRDREVELSVEAGARCPMLTDAMGWIGHVEIRNQGTVCGSLAHADPFAELPLVAVALDAELVARSRHGQRTIPASEFFVSYLTTSLQPDELLTEVHFPTIDSTTGWSFMELARRRGDYALVAVAALLQADGNGACKQARVVLGGVDSIPHRAAAAEQALLGQALTLETFRAAGQASVTALDPPDDVQASGAYRRKVAAVLVERALAQAAERLPAEEG